MCKYNDSGQCLYRSTCCDTRRPWVSTLNPRLFLSLLTFASRHGCVNGPKVPVSPEGIPERLTPSVSILMRKPVQASHTAARYTTSRVISLMTYLAARNLPESSCRDQNTHRLLTALSAGWGTELVRHDEAGRSLLIPLTTKAWKYAAAPMV